jgi:dihydroxy-acid dehydratase
VRTGDLITVDVPGPHHPPRSLGRGTRVAPRRLDPAPAPLRARLRLASAQHITQADEGCDFDFLETGFGKAVEEPAIY